MSQMWNDPSTNCKTTLVEFCQRLIGKSMGRGDIVYKVDHFPGDGVQAVVKINCIGGQEFTSELCPGQKEAEQGAARAALESLQAEADSTLKRKASDSGGPPTKFVRDANGREVAVLHEGAIDLQMKSRLREAVKQLVGGRDLVDGDIEYDFEEADGGSICVLKLPCLEDEFVGGQSWRSSASPYRRDAILEAAAAALATLEAHYGEQIDLSKVPDAEVRKEMRKKKNPTPVGPGEMEVSGPMQAMARGALKGKGKGALKGKGKSDPVWGRRWDMIANMVAEMMNWSEEEWARFEEAAAEDIGKPAFFGAVSAAGKYGKGPAGKGCIMPPGKGAGFGMKGAGPMMGMGKGAMGKGMFGGKGKW